MRQKTLGMQVVMLSSCPILQSCWFKDFIYNQFILHVRELTLIPKIYSKYVSANPPLWSYCHKLSERKLSYIPMLFATRAAVSVH